MLCSNSNVNVIHKTFFDYQLSDKMDWFRVHNVLNCFGRRYDDVIKCNHFPRYWPFVRGIHRSTVNSPHKRPVTRSFDVFFDLHSNKRLGKQWRGWWCGTPCIPLWRHCNEVSVNTSSVRRLNVPCGCCPCLIRDNVSLISDIEIADLWKPSKYSFKWHITMSYILIVYFPVGTN